MKRLLLVAMCALTAFTALAADKKAEEWNWIDAKTIPVEGRPFADAPEYWCRFPAWANDMFTPRYQRLAKDTCCMVLRFRTDSDKVKIRWSLLDGEYIGFVTMSPIGVSGIDVYCEDTRFTPAWKHISCGYPKHQDWNEVQFWAPGPKRTILVYLPLLNHPTRLEIGLLPGRKILPAPPHATGVTKPVVFYGGSTTQGVGASRPGMAWVNTIGRLLDIPVVSMGLNGCGKCEEGMEKILTAIDSSAIVLQGYANMYNGAETDDPRFEGFVRKIRALKPETPIVLLEYNYPLESYGYKHKGIPALVAKLKAEGWQNLHTVRLVDMFAPDTDMTSDGGHMNDWGQQHFARAVAKVLGPVVIK